jgi:addiction module HigA family antidote
MTMTRVRSHPGQLLRAELDARQISAHQLALMLRVPPNRISSILRGERSITAETALRLGRFLGTGPAFWMNLQTAHDVSVAEAELGDLIEAEVPAPSR